MDPRSNAARVVRRKTGLAIFCLALAELEAGNTMSAMEVLHIAVTRELVPIYQAGRILMAPGVDPAEVHGMLLAWSWGNDPDTEFIRVRVAETAMASLNRQVDLSLVSSNLRYYLHAKDIEIFESSLNNELDYKEPESLCLECWKSMSSPPRWSPRPTTSPKPWSGTPGRGWRRSEPSRSGPSRRPGRRRRVSPPSSKAKGAKPHM